MIGLLDGLVHRIHLRRSTARTAVAATPVRHGHCALAVSNEMTAMGMRRSSMGHNKLVQIAQGRALAQGHELIVEMPEVWRYGPVLRSLYLVQNHKGHEILEAPLMAGPFDPAPRIDPDDVWTLDLIRRVVDDHAGTTCIRLSEMMHGDDTPWRIEAESNDFRVPIGHAVPAHRILKHFSALAEAA